MSASFAESTVEEAALAWLASSGFAVAHGPDIAVGQPGAERSDPTYRDVVLEWRLREALVRLNPDLPQEALDDAFRKIVRADGPSLIERNRAVHRMLVDGVTVEYRRADGSIAGAQARVIDFDDPDNNDWLAVNQFTVVGPQGHNRRADIVIFVNGLPLGVIELKNPADEKATIWSALQPAPDIPVADPGALRLQLRARRLGRHRGADRRPGRGQGVVQALAHDRWARRCAQRGCRSCRWSWKASSTRAGSWI